MKVKLLIAAMMILALVLSGIGCSGPAEEPSDTPEQEPISGTIYRFDDGRILVVEDIDNVNIPWSKWFEQGHRAVYFALEDDTIVELNGEESTVNILARGQKVEVYHEGFLAESYPEQGKAFKVVVTDQSSAEEELLESGRFIGLTEDGLLELKISGTPEELPAKSYAITNEAREVLSGMELSEEEVILIRYTSDETTDGLIFDLEKIEN
jgi:hypothetical protein